jgi:F-type H+-transporting ATPase subunit a
MAATGLHISISAEHLTTILGVSVTNSMLSSVIISVLLISAAALVRSQLVATDRPKGLQNVAEWIVEALYNLVESVAGNTKKTRQFFPLIATFFLFILLNNWFGLIPGVGTIGFIEKSESTEHAVLLQNSITTVGQTYASEEVTYQDTTTTPTESGEMTARESAPAGEELQEESAGEAKAIFVPYFRAGTADLNMTIALGLISIFMTQLFGVQFLGLSYFSKYINFSSPIMFFVGILEIISEFAKIISFAFRLFGNIFAGEVLLAVISYIGKVVVPMPFYGLELFVGMIQALVFAMLSLVFFNIATQGHESDHSAT